MSFKNFSDDRIIDWFKNGKEIKGKSSLKRWTYPECWLNVRVGIARNPLLRHHACEIAAGRPVFLIPRDVYVAKEP